MLSITPINYRKTVPFAKNEPDNKALVNSILSSTNVSDSKKYAQQGDEFLKQNEFQKAIQAYKKSLELRPDYLDTHYELAKAYKFSSDYKNAVTSFEKYLQAKPNHAEANILLGECYTQLGNYNQAKIQFTKGLTIEPDNDLAKRNLKETENYLLACYSPQQAKEAKKQQSVANLTKAINMARGYLPNGYMNELSDITVTFDKTSEMGGTANIAQYEHNKRKITVTDKYIYAAPQLICSYLVHEFVHAKDNDPYTSVREEQDAYRKATEFWVKNSKGVQDPEMDYAAGLYETSPETLDNRVAEIYQLRDPKISKTSPNHPPVTGRAASSQLNEAACGQPIRTYDVIA